MSKGSNLSSDISIRMNKVAGEKNDSYSTVTFKVNKYLPNSESVSDSTVRRFLLGESKPTAVFVEAFCNAYDVSERYILGADSVFAENGELTPEIILYNLVLVLKQCEFAFDKNEDSTKGMLITNNKGLIDFLSMIFSLSNYNNLRPVDISRISEVIRLKLYNNKIVTSDEYYDLHGKAFVAFNTDELSLKFKGTEIYKIERQVFKDKCISYWDECSDEKKDELIKSNYVYGCLEDELELSDLDL